MQTVDHVDALVKVIAESARTGSIVNGRIFVKAKGIGPDVDGNVVTLVPANSSGAALTYAPGTTIDHWVCGAAGDGTTIPSKYLPGACRAV